jgi:outer membrane protein insertion porin family
MVKLGFVLLALLCACTPPPADAPTFVPEPAKSRETLACEGRPVEGPPRLSYTSPVDLIGPVRALEIQGSTSVEAEALSKIILTPLGQPIDRKRLREDVVRIWALGHYDDVAVILEPLDDGVRLRFVMRESAQVVRTFVRGGEALREMVLRSLQGVVLPTSFDPSWVLEIEDSLRELYQEQGYRGVKVDSRVAKVADGEVDLCVRIEQGPRSTIESIVFEGNDAVPDRDLASLLDTGRINTVGGVYSAARFERALLYMQALYYDRGYLESRLIMDPPETSADGTHLRVVVRISEGAQYRLASLSFEGPKKEAYPALMQVKAGDIFNRSKLVASLRAIEAMHRQRGERVRVEPINELDKKHSTVELLVRVVAY